MRLNTATNGVSGIRFHLVGKGATAVRTPTGLQSQFADHHGAGQVTVATPPAWLRTSAPRCCARSRPVASRRMRPRRGLGPRRQSSSSSTPAKWIEEIDAGRDAVLAIDPGSDEPGEPVAKDVVATHINVDVVFADLGIVDGRGRKSKLHTTQDHPFWSETSDSWVLARDLRPGDVLGAIKGTGGRVVSVHDFVGIRVMYDLTVDDIHTYHALAGNTPVLVHNRIRLVP